MARVLIIGKGAEFHAQMPIHSGREIIVRSDLRPCTRETQGVAARHAVDYILHAPVGFFATRYEVPTDA